MNSDTSSFDEAAESRTVRLVRAVTWFGILAAALSFRMLAAWLAWAYWRS